MEFTTQFADKLGPYKIISIFEPSIHLKAVLVIDNIACGPSIGGIRMAPDVNTGEAFRLARAMTLKNAAAGLPHGGGKSVIAADHKALSPQEKEQLIRCFATAIKDIKEYIPGPDMGTDELCMAWIKDETGRAIGLPKEIGGIPLDEIGATGFGLSHCIEESLPFINFPLQGAKIVIQGFGSVGKHAARFLTQKGAIIVGVADSGGTLHNPDGLDIQELLTLKSQRKSVTSSLNGIKMSKDEIIDISCDIWIPAARPDVINETNVHRLQTKMVASGANIPITAAAEIQLHQKGIMVIPDYIANAGGVICGAVEYNGGNQNDALTIIEEKIRSNTKKVLEIAVSKNIPPREAAFKLATERIQKAMECKRWSIF